MPPKKDSSTPSTTHFAIVELHAGKKSWRAGSSGRPVHLKGFSGMPPKTIPRHEITLRGKVLFGLNRFAFEVQEFDNDAKAVAGLLKKGGRGGSEVDETHFGVLLARDLAPLSSLQVKFDDIEKVEQAGDTITLLLKGAPACYQKAAGQSSTCNPKVAKDITQGAKTLQFKIGPANLHVQRSSERQQLEFTEVKTMIMAHSPRLRALFLGQMALVLPPLVTPQKKRKNETPASITKRLKKEARGKASSKEDVALLDADEAKRKLTEYVKSLASTVDADWHDSYEETGEMLQEWFNDIGEHVQNILRVGVVKGEEFGQSHELLKQIADAWSNIQAIPFRGCPRDDISNGDGVVLFQNDDDGCEVGGTVNCPDELLTFTWPALLARAAADEKVPDAALLQMIKDAHDHGVASPHLPADGEAKLKLPKVSTRALQQGRQRLSQLFARQEQWNALPSTKKVHRMRRCIDRRFDGPKHLRTRDYDSDDEGADGCSVM